MLWQYVFLSSSNCWGPLDNPVKTPYLHRITTSQHCCNNYKQLSKKQHMMYFMICNSTILTISQ